MKDYQQVEQWLREQGVWEKFKKHFNTNSRSGWTFKRHVQWWGSDCLFRAFNSNRTPEGYQFWKGVRSKFNEWYLTN
ncbi:MAG: hypothetical protein R3Y59_10275 [bacterium]